MNTPRNGSAARVPAAAPRPAPTVPLLNAANVLTLSRCALVPVFLVILFTGGGHQPGWRLVATAVFVLASLTDQVDGTIARSRGLVTAFGTIADPIADKALTGSALIGLSVLGELPWWVTVVVTVREIGITVLRFCVIRRRVIGATWGGKAKTLSQVVAIVLYLLPLPTTADPLRWVVMGIAVGLTVVTGVDYVVRVLRRPADGRDHPSGHAPATGP